MVSHALLERRGQVEQNEQQKGEKHREKDANQDEKAEREAALRSDEASALDSNAWKTTYHVALAL